MKNFLKACRECWIVTSFMAVLILANGVHMVISLEHGDVALPFFLRILDIF